MDQGVVKSDGVPNPSPCGVRWTGCTAKTMPAGKAACGIVML